MQEFTRNVLSVIAKIPKGRVMSYGQIAKVCLNPRGARQVSYILHSMTRKYDLPWHRVVNSRGKISLTGESYRLQKQLLKNEGIEFSDHDVIDFNRFGVHS